MPAFGRKVVSPQPAPSGPCQPVTNLLRLKYNIDEGAGPTINDSGPYGYHGTQYGEWVAGPTGPNPALYFGNTSQFVTIPNSFALSGNRYSLACQIKMDTVTGTVRQVFTDDYLASGNFQRYFQFRINPDGLVRFVRFDSGNNVASAHSSSVPITTNWTWIFATFDSTVGSKIYIDDVERGSDPSTTLNRAGSSTIGPRIGQSRTGSNGAALEPMIGAVAHARVYDRALTQAEITCIVSGVG